MPVSLSVLASENLDRNLEFDIAVRRDGNVPGSRRMFGKLARGGNRDVRRWVRSTRSSAGNDFTQAIEGISTRNDASDAVSLSTPSYPSLVLARSLARPCTRLCFQFCFGPALASTPFSGCLNRRRQWRVRKERVCVTCPRGWQDCEHTATGLRFRVADRSFKAAVVY